MTVRIRFAVPVWPDEFVAERVMLKEPTDVGIPERTAPLRLSPAGKPVALKLEAAGLEVMV